MIASVPLIEGVISKNNSGMARYWPLTLLAAAMGLQTATLTRVGPLTVHTTFVTGMVNKLAQLLSHMMFRSFDLLGFSSGRLSSSPAANDDAQQAAFLFSIWTLYVSGAVCGTWLYKLWGMRALFLATGLILFGIAMDQFCALSIQEEKEQLEG
jgi:uncharacterized membrane protein YoaK (UPF0700 family)